MTAHLAEYILRIAKEIDPEVGQTLADASAEFEQISAQGKGLAARRFALLQDISNARFALKERALARLKVESRPQGEEVPVAPDFLAFAREQHSRLGLVVPFDQTDYMAIKGRGLFVWLPGSGKWHHRADPG